MNLGTLRSQTATFAMLAAFDWLLLILLIYPIKL